MVLSLKELQDQLDRGWQEATKDQRQKHWPESCPDCGGMVQYGEGCKMCPACGWNPCYGC